MVPVLATASLAFGPRLFMTTSLKADTTTPPGMADAARFRACSIPATAGSTLSAWAAVALIVDTEEATSMFQLPLKLFP
jgi:hypothetical protein